MDIKAYKKDFEYSYTLGAFPTFELLNTRPESVLTVLVHSTFPETDKIKNIAAKYNIPVEVNDKLINKLSDKENCFVIGIFKKFDCELSEHKPHVVLVNPSNMGNMGTIMRTAIGFGIKDMAIISPGVDIYNPKTVRASMGALFRLNTRYFDSFEEYMEQYKEHEIYCFMLNANNQLDINNCPHSEIYSLVFGNEATGLPDKFLDYGKSIIIPQTPEVDSLNITIAAGVGIFVFTQKQF